MGPILRVIVSQGRHTNDLPRPRGSGPGRGHAPRGWAGEAGGKDLRGRRDTFCSSYDILLLRHLCDGQSRGDYHAWRVFHNQLLYVDTAHCTRGLS